MLHRARDRDGFDFWIKALGDGATRTQMLEFFADSPENHAQVIGVVQHGIEYTPNVA